VDLERLREALDKLSGRQPAQSTLEPSQDVVDE
jgi:hypothetical protein